ncbi:aminopeptidase P family protein [Streptomyces resistomycificus]|uniref:Peptidase M24 n=1 Tax=Streptomyces resistomycificus TaxID=67356 RepID=A0A0L8KY58_9ACTN|nr:aminopeptidase P family protein [Streptomyces resistomycificus]KOG30729.1 peptidase M24 [Streptomyces resistomycificus]KUN97663.1 peptidase M24 [Streptomyces resistomycificus]
MSETPVAFTEQDHADRMVRAARDAVSAGLAGLLVTPGPDLTWLCGYRPAVPTERLTLLVLVPESEPRLLVPALERPDAEAAPGAGALRLSEWRDGQDPYAAAAGLLRPNGHYGVSDSTRAVHLLGLQEALPMTTYRALTTVLPMLRAVKDDHEVARLAAAGTAADAAYEEILSVRFAGRRERDVAADLARLLRAHGHGQVDFTVVGSGPNGADPHHEAGERVIEDGDMVVLDFGGLKDGYGSDTTRTVHVGEPTDEERAVHDVVRQAQQAAFEAVRPGVPCQEIDRVARTVVEAAGYGAYCVRRTGHGVGVTTHEPPYLVRGEQRPLVAGMCFSIEPGICLPGRFGVRIEDVVTCTETGGRRLNTTPHEMAVVS